MRATFFPFGQGIRNCIGEGFAWAESTLLLSAIAARWQLRLADGADVHPVVSSTLVPSELPIIVTRRRPAPRPVFPGASSQPRVPLRPAARPGALRRSRTADPDHFKAKAPQPGPLKRRPQRACSWMSRGSGPKVLTGQQGECHGERVRRAVAGRRAGGACLVREPLTRPSKGCGVCSLVSETATGVPCSGVDRLGDPSQALGD